MNEEPRPFPFSLASFDWRLTQVVRLQLRHAGLKSRLDKYRNLERELEAELTALEAEAYKVAVHHLARRDD